jgi:hypothetical protein
VGLSFRILVRLLGYVFLGFWLGYLCILSYVLRGALRFFLYIQHYLSKKKKKRIFFLTRGEGNQHDLHDKPKI